MISLFVSSCCLRLRLSVFLPLFSSLCLSVRHSVYGSACCLYMCVLCRCLSACVCVCLCVCVSVCLSLSEHDKWSCRRSCRHPLVDASDFLHLCVFLGRNAFFWRRTAAHVKIQRCSDLHFATTSETKSATKSATHEDTNFDANQQHRNLTNPKSNTQIRRTSDTKISRNTKCLVTAPARTGGKYCSLLSFRSLAVPNRTSIMRQHLQPEPLNKVHERHRFKSVLDV